MKEQIMKRLVVLCLLLCGISLFSYAQDRHELDNMHVKINSNEFSKSRRIDHKKSGSRDYIYGESSAYLLTKNKPLSRLSAPYAQYPIKAGMAGGTYRITIAYRADKTDKYTGDPMIIVGFDEKETEEIMLDKTSRVKKKTIDFKTSMLRGKNHILKLWLPTPGVEIDYIEIRRKLINK